MTAYLQRAERPARRPALVAFLTIVTIVVASSLAAAHPTASPGFSTASATPATNWLSYNTGRVSVVFPTPTPAVTLAQDANASVSGRLSIAQILEIAPGSSTVVAAAFPPEVSGFNGSHPLSSSSWPVSLSAHLNVYPSAPLSPTGSGVHPSTPPVGAADLTVNYQLVPAGGTGDGVVLDWAVGGWPWVSPADVLAVELSFTPATAGPLLACSSAPTLVGGSGCHGSSIPAGGVTWTPGIVGVEGDTSTGPTTSVSWSPSVTVSSLGSVPASVAVYTTTSGTADAIVGAPAQGADSVGGTVDFTVVAPLPAVHLPAVVHGNGPVYGAAVAIFGLAAALGVVAYRRYERRVTNAL